MSRWIAAFLVGFIIISGFAAMGVIGFGLFKIIESDPTSALYFGGLVAGLTLIGRFALWLTDDWDYL